MWYFMYHNWIFFIMLLFFQNCSVAIVGKDDKFTVFEDEEVAKFVSFTAVFEHYLHIPLEVMCFLIHTLTTLCHAPCHMPWIAISSSVCTAIWVLGVLLPISKGHFWRKKGTHFWGFFSKYRPILHIFGCLHGEHPKILEILDGEHPKHPKLWTFWNTKKLD